MLLFDLAINTVLPCVNLDFAGDCELDGCIGKDVVAANFGGQS